MTCQLSRRLESQPSPSPLPPQVSAYPLTKLGKILASDVGRMPLKIMPGGGAGLNCMTQEQRDGKAFHMSGEACATSFRQVVATVDPEAYTMLQ